MKAAGYSVALLAGLLGLLCCREQVRPLEPLPASSGVLLNMEYLMWLREQPFNVANLSLQGRGWRLVYTARDTSYASDAHVWAGPQPLPWLASDTVSLAISYKYPAVAGESVGSLLKHTSPSPWQYQLIYAQVKAAQLALSSHSDREGSDFMIFEGPHQAVILSRDEWPRQEFKISIEYDDPNVTELAPPDLNQLYPEPHK